MSPAQINRRCRSMLLGITLAVVASLCGLPLTAQVPNPVPLINLPLVPDAAAPGGPQFTLTINGTGFVSNSTVNWNRSPLATTFVSSSQLTAIVPAANIATATTGWVTVVNPSPGGGTSNLVFFTVTPTTAAVAFNLVSSPAAGGRPQAVALGDFNGDGNLDLAVANWGAYGSSTVNILLGDGTGNFTQAASVTTPGYGLDGIAVGDFNGDGNLDLAVAGYQSGVLYILLGDGTGNFALTSSPATNGYPTSVAVGDFNGDGNLDLATTNLLPSTVSIFLGDGTGNFTLTSSIPVGTNPYSVATGDFNRDGYLDLVTANDSSNSVSILLGDGTGNFTVTSSIPVSSTGSTSVSVGDFNGDGKLDLAVVNYWWCRTCTTSSVSVLLGDGTGHFTEVSNTSNDSWVTWCATLGDFNGDNKLDVATSNEGNGNVSVMLGDGAGHLSVAGLPGAGSYTSALASGDFNNDGMLDLAAVNAASGTASILLQVPATPAISITPSSLTFGTQLIGTMSPAQTVTLTNTGNALIDITRIAISANFSQTNNCGSTLEPGANCTITVTFAPGRVGKLSGAMTITDNAPGSPQKVSLSGVSTEVTLSPTALSFGSQTVGTTSAPQTVTLTNSGSQALSISGIRFSGPDFGDFAQTNTCGSSVAAGTSCAINVTFTPRGQGSRTATLDVADNGGASPQTASLTGSGTK